MHIYIAGYGHSMGTTLFFKQAKPNILLSFYGHPEYCMSMIIQGKKWLAANKEKTIPEPYQDLPDLVTTIENHAIKEMH